MKRANGKCEECGDMCSKTKTEQVKKGGKRLEVHHTEPCDMTALAKTIHNRLFGCELDVLCQECHAIAEENIQRLK